MRLLFTLLVVLSFAWGGAAWYLSEQVRTGIIQVQPFDHQANVPVVATAFEEITLGHVDVGETELDRGEVAGLVWPGGYGQVTDLLAARGTEIRRTFSVLEGEAPEPGTLVAVDEYAYPDDPGILGLDHRAYSIAGPLGPLPAWEFPAVDGAPWVVMVHGRQARGLSEMLRFVPMFHDAGFTVLIASYRNDDGAPAVEDRRVEFGRTEWEDLGAVVDHALGESDDVSVLGASMGGAITLSWMINDPTTAARLRAVVLDSPAVDVAGIVRHNAAEITYAWREFEFSPPGPLVETTLLLGRLRHGYDWDAMDYVARADALPDVPILVLHGGRDVSVPIESSRAFADGAVRARLIEYPEAAHTRLWNVDPDRYRGDVLGFLDGHAP